MKEREDGTKVFELSHDERRVLGEMLEGTFGTILKQARQEFLGQLQERMLDSDDETTLQVKQQIKGVRRFLDLLEATRIKSVVRRRKEQEQEQESQSGENSHTTPTAPG